MDKRLTAAQIRSVESLCGRAEALENRLPPGRAQEYVAEAKRRLIDALRAAGA